MFERLFAESGFSLDRLRALVEVGAAGSIVKAVGTDPVRQSQYSRQIKELEDFFHTRLIERQGKGTRLTASGRELARISRFFLLGLSNFHRGCLAEEQTFRIAGSATFVRTFLLPTLARESTSQLDRAKTPSPRRARYSTEAATDADIERRLHELTLDFGLVANAKLSRPLQTRLLGEWKLDLWAPKALRLSNTVAARAYEQGQLPLVLAREANLAALQRPNGAESRLLVDSFLEARLALEQQHLATWLPTFLAPSNSQFIRVSLPKFEPPPARLHLAWNPRLLRLNPNAQRKKDWLAEALAGSTAPRTIGH
jgi:DNA-binding transcriptional LysR family regulator